MTEHTYLLHKIADTPPPPSRASRVPGLTLLQDIIKSGVNVLSRPKKIIRDSIIKYECNNINCSIIHSKTARQLSKTGAYCKGCTTKEKIQKSKATKLLYNHDPAHQAFLKNQRHEALLERELKLPSQLDEETRVLVIVLRKYVICAKIICAKIKRISFLKIILKVSLVVKAYHTSLNKIKGGASIEMFDKDKHIKFLKPLHLKNGQIFKEHYLLQRLRSTSKVVVDWYANPPLSKFVSRKIHLPLKAESEGRKMCLIGELLSTGKLSQFQKGKLFCTYAEFKDFCKNTIVYWAEINVPELYTQVYGKQARRGLTRKGGNNVWRAWIKYNDIPSHIPRDARSHYKEEWILNGGWNGLFDTHKPCIDSNYITKKDRSNKQLAEQLRQHPDIKHDLSAYSLPGVYLYTFPDNTQYVGKTQKTVLTRTNEHVEEAYRGNPGCTKLNHKIRQLCMNNEENTLEEARVKFYKLCKIEVLYKGDDLLDEKESEFINKYDTLRGSHGLNLQPGNVGPTGLTNHLGEKMPRNICIKDKGYYVAIYGTNGSKSSKNFLWKELSMDKKYSYAVKLKKFPQEKLQDGKLRCQIYTSKEMIEEFCKKHNLNCGSNKPQQFGHNEIILPENVYYNDKGYSIKTSENRGRDINIFSTKSDEYKSLDKQYDLSIKILDWVSKSDLSLIEIDTRTKVRAILKEKYPSHTPGSSRTPLVDLIIQLMINSM